MKSFARSRKLFGVIVCSFVGDMDSIFSRISADFSTVWTGLRHFLSHQNSLNSTPDMNWNAAVVSYLKEIQEKGFQYGIFVADSKLVTRSLVESMNEPEGHIPFVSRCPSNFEGKLAEIAKRVGKAAQQMEATADMERRRK